MSATKNHLDDVPLIQFCIEKNIEKLLQQLPEAALEPPERPVLLAKNASDDNDWCINHTVFKTEAEIEAPNRPRQLWKIHRCEFCTRRFTSIYEKSRHENTHRNVNCPNCHLVCATPKDLRDHFDFCSRKNGIKIIPRIQRNKPEPKRRFSCCLCNRKYIKYQHLFDHQVKRCQKRYQSERWVVKI